MAVQGLSWGEETRTVKSTHTYVVSSHALFANCLFFFFHTKRDVFKNQDIVSYVVSF